MKKKGHLNWFFWFMMCIFLAVMFKEIDGSGSVYQMFSKSLIKIKVPYIHNLTALGFGCIVLLFAYLVAFFFSRIINDIFDEGEIISGFFMHDNSKVLKTITGEDATSDE